MRVCTLIYGQHKQLDSTQIRVRGVPVFTVISLENNHLINILTICIIFHRQIYIN